MARNPELTVDFTPDDYQKMVDTANDRGYSKEREREGLGLIDYVHDCALGKFEPQDPGNGEHVRLALLVWALAREAWARVEVADNAWRGTCEAAFSDALREVLADAADQGRLG